MIALAAAGLLLGFIALALVRLFGGPTLYDRAAALNVALTLMALLLGAVAVLREDGAIVESAIGLVFSLLVANAAVLKFFAARSFQGALGVSGEEVKS